MSWKVVGLTYHLVFVPIALRGNIGLIQNLFNNKRNQKKKNTFWKSNLAYRVQYIEKKTMLSSPYHDMLRLDFKAPKMDPNPSPTTILALLSVSRVKYDTVWLPEFCVCVYRVSSSYPLFTLTRKFLTMPTFLLLLLLLLLLRVQYHN